MSIPNPNPNIADGIKCDNKTYSSNKIESLITAATELPIPEAGDAGKVLTVNSDSDGYELDDIPAELPVPGTGDAGKVLTVNAAEDGYELDTPVDPTSIIDDAAAAADTVYSSSKVNDLLSGKQATLETQDYTITLANNSYVSPFLTYFETDISADIPAGKQVQSVVIHASATNPCTFTVNNLGKLRIYGTKEEDVYVVVTFI